VRCGFGLTGRLARRFPPVRQPGLRFSRPGGTISACGNSKSHLLINRRAPAVHITLKLFATLSDYLPAGALRNQVTLEVEPGRTVGGLIAEHHLPEKLVHLVLVNGNYIAPAMRDSHLLKDGDTLAIWPPVAGG
jgi:molybdopterin converting factor small subunit